MRHLVFIFCLFFSLQMQGAHVVQRISTANGLSTDEVTQCYQDKDGFIWIATYDGLCRYDGSLVKTYKSNLYTPGLLSNNKIKAIAEDGNNHIWIGTENGLNILDKTTGTIRQIPPGKLKNNIVQVILTTKGNDVWIGTANGLHKYEAEKDTFVYFNNASTGYRMRGNDIKTLIEDDKGNIWIGTWSEGITRLDPAKGIFYPYPRINPSNSAHILFQDNQRTIWVGSWGYGLFRLENPYNPDKTTYVNYRSDINHKGSLSDNLVYSISQDLITNYIWVGTRSGLSVLSDRQNPYSFTNSLPGESDLPYNEISSIIRDRSGLMWLGSYGGGVFAIKSAVSKFHSNELNPVKNKIASNSVRSLYIDGKGVIWMGIGSYGLVSFLPEKNQYVYYGDHPDFRGNPITATINMSIQQGGNYWFATNGQGIFVYNPDLHTVKNIKADTHPWLYSNMVLCLKEDSNHNIWVGTAEGVSVYNSKTGKGFSYPSMGQKVNGNHYAVNCIAQGDSNTMWAATREHGLFRIETDPATSRIVRFEHYSEGNNRLNNDNLQYVYKDGNGQIWIGTNGSGLGRYNPEKDVFTCVQQDYNIPGDIVYNITEDRQGNLWMGTNVGLIVLKNGVAQQYTIADGLQSNFFNDNAVFRNPDGELYFGGHNGYNHFYPEEITANEFCGPIAITDIKIYNKSLEMLDAKLRKTISVNAPGYTRKIRLPYSHNNFSIEFAVLNYSKTTNKYAYKLNGFDTEWQYTDASKRYASYNNLKSGVYHFQLKAMNESGVWSNVETLEVEILPPSWQTWWAYLIYCGIIGLIVYFIIRIAQHKIMISNTVHIQNMEKQKIEELNNVKLQFFTNITHELLTPLTILSASVDELRIVAPQQNSFYDVMTNNINRLIRLLQQILEFRKAESGNLKLKVAKGDIAAFVRNCVDNFNPLMKKNKIHFSLICDPESIPAYFDHDKLDKILFNLLSNASKYNQQGGYVQVDIGYDSGIKERVLISVKDNGGGIKPAAVKNLFKRFYEGDYRRFNTIGTGIGLSLTKDLVELHKGSISVDSEEGKGAVFQVRLPINMESFEENEIDDYTYTPKKIVPVDNVENEEGKLQKSKEHTLLLIEDNEELLSVMVQFLKREYNIFTAVNGKEGIGILEKENVDLTISDIVMPIMDGLELCKYVKNKFEISHVPIILLTAKNTEEDRIESYDSGADGFIPKPFSMNVLHSKIKNLLLAKEKKAKRFNTQFIIDNTGDDLEYTSIDEDFLKKAVDCVHKHIGDSGFDQQQFANELGTSKSTLYKKLKSLTGLNTTSFIRNIRMEAAHKIIEEKTTIRISELAYAVGFSDPKYFSKCFKQKYGLIPSEYLARLSPQEQGPITYDEIKETNE